jgi:hypothetical protein
LSNPRSFPRERLSSLGGSRSAQSPNSKPCFIPPTNPPDSPPVELDTCHLSSQTQESPSELLRRAHDPLHHQQYRHAAGAALLSCRTQDLACSLGAAAEGDVAYWAAQPPPPTHPTPPCLLTTHLAHPRPLPRRRSSSARPWYPPTPSDTIDQAPPP